MGRLLTKEETLKCLKAYREYGDDDAITLLIKCNKGLVVSTVKKYLNKGLSFDELESSGNLGLFHAINKFDYTDVNGSFYAYALTSVENQIKADLKRKQRYEKEISIYEPIGHNKDGDDLTLEDIIGTDEEELFNNVISEMKIDIVKEALTCLTSRERQIILLRYGLDEAHRKTQEEVASIFNCSTNTIRSQEQKAIKKMRHPRNTKKLKDFIDE